MVYGAFATKSMQCTAQGVARALFREFRHAVRSENANTWRAAPPTPHTAFHGAENPAVQDACSAQQVHFKCHSLVCVSVCACVVLW